MGNIEEKIKEAKLKRAINIANKYWVMLAVMMVIFQHYNVNPIFGQITTGLWVVVLFLGAIGFLARDDKKNKFYAEYLDKVEEIEKIKKLEKLKIKKDEQTKKYLLEKERIKLEKYKKKYQ